MENGFEIWYPVIIESQLDFEGHAHQKEVFATGHISYNGRLMCGESREVLKNRLKVAPISIVKDKTAKIRAERTKVCVACQKKYRENKQSAWSAWVEGKPKTVAVKLPALNKF